MSKRGQVTVYIIIGILLIIVVSLFFSFKNTELVSEYDDLPVTFSFQIESFIETCLADSLKKGVVLSGSQGGYISTIGDYEYGEYGISYYSIYQGRGVPFYLNDVGPTNIPTIDQIENKLERYTIVEFEKCLDFTEFANQGYVFTMPTVDYYGNDFDFEKLPVDIDVEINEGNVIADVYYPIIVRQGNLAGSMNKFSVVLNEVRYGLLYDAAYGSAGISTVNDIKDAWNADDEFSAESINTDKYDYLKMVNLYVDDDDMEYSNIKIIRLVDYYPYYNGWKKPFELRFAVKKNPVNVSGEAAEGTVVI